MKRVLCGIAATLLAVGALGVAPAWPASAATTIVLSPHGTMTIQQAVHTLSNGGTIELRGGSYAQRVTFRAAHNITLRPYRGQHAELDGRRLTPPQGDSGLITIVNSTNITVEGLDLTGYRTTHKNVVPIGIYIHGHDTAIRIVRNHVHDLGNDNNTLGSFDINAHGIAAYGDDPHSAIEKLVLRDNRVDNLHLGASESVVVNGNVNHWRIVGNNIHDNDNIGIDAIGFEPTLPGKYRYTQLNRARNGVIANNVIARIRSRGNPAYWEGGGWCNCADGIYIDGGAHITVRSNGVDDSDIGIEVAAENARGSADHVVVVRNHVTGSLFTGISTGGYCDGARGCGNVQTGTSHDNVFKYNVLRSNNRLDDGSPEFLVQYHAHHNTFVHNTVIATNTDHVIYGTVPRSDSSHNRSDHNDFRAIGGSRATAAFGWGKHTYTGFAKYRAATGQDAHSHFGAPK
jgi:hypothetical protein